MKATVWAFPVWGIENESSVKVRHLIGPQFLLVDKLQSDSEGEGSSLDPEESSGLSRETGLAHTDTEFMFIHPA